MPITKYVIAIKQYFKYVEANPESNDETNMCIYFIALRSASDLIVSHFSHISGCPMLTEVVCVRFVRRTICS